MTTDTIETTAAGKVGSYRDLIAWQKAMDLLCRTYGTTARLPTEERFGLRAEMRRSAVSIPSNIAEGWGRDTTPDYIRFLYIGRGSQCELSTQAAACLRLGYRGDWPEIITGCDELGRILNGLINSLRERIGRKAAH